MADALIVARGQASPPPPTGQCWVSRFVNSQPELQTKWNRKFHSQRARCEDPVAIAAWFKLVEETRQALTAETPRTVAQLQQQARRVQDLLRRQSQSPISQAIRQLVKGCQLAMNSATVLTEEVKKLCTASERQQRRKGQRRQYIARGGALQVQQGQQLAAEAERVVAEGEQAQATQGRQRAPPTCSKCHIQGQTRTQCRQ